jgi:hypothetical protein
LDEKEEHGFWPKTIVVNATGYRIFILTTDPGH